MDNTKKAKRKDIRRRALAALCAITIAVLQCAVILTIDTESVYGGEKIKVSVYVPSVGSDTHTSNSFTVSDIGSGTDLVIGHDPETGDPITIKGYPVGALVDKIKISENPQKITMEDGSLKDIDSSDMIVEKDGKVYIYKQEGDVWTEKANAKNGLDMTMSSSYKPAINSISISPNTLSLKKDEQKDLTATVSFKDSDGFFNDSSDEAKKYVDITWSCVPGSGAVTFSPEKGMKTTITVQTAGTYTIKATDSSGVEGNVKDDGSQATTTTKPTEKPTVDPKDLGNATVKSDGKLVKGKAYTNSEMKSHLTLKDPNGKTIDKKNWDVISIDRDGNNYTVTIKASTTGKKNGYTGYNESTLKATKTATTTKYKYTTRKYSGGGVTRSTRINATGGETTSSLPPTVTYAPDRTITVKEVFLGGKVEDDQQESQNPWDDSYSDQNDDGSDDWTETEMQEEISLDFGPAAGSAAVAVAACGAGVVGRIRRFRVDTRAVDAAASQTGKTKKLKLKK